MLLLVCIVPTVNAASNTFVFSKAKSTMLYGNNYLGHNSNINFYYKVTTDGKIVYCTESHDTIASNLETYTYC